MKESTKNKNYFKNNYYRFKIEPLDFDQMDYLNESDIQKLDKRSDINHLLRFKIKPTYYTFFIKADTTFGDHVLVDIDDYVMTIMQLSCQKDQLNQSNEKLSGFAHSFVIPENIKLNEIKLYGVDNILLIIIPRL